MPLKLLRCSPTRHTAYVDDILSFLTPDSLVHQCIMITGDNPLTAVHVAREVEIVDREALILDLRESPAHDAGMFCSPRLRCY